MKKKFLSFIFAICLIVPCMFALTACGKDKCNGNHTSGNLIRTESATCEEYGKKIYECQNCGEEYAVEDYSVLPLGHTYEDDINCEVCNKEYVDTNLKFKLNDTQDGYIVAWNYDEEAVSQYPYNGDYSLYYQENCENKDGQQSIINIPSEYNGLPVVEIAQGGFVCLLDENFELPIFGDSYDPISGVQPDSPLYALTHYIRAIKIPSSVKKIGASAFMPCYSGVNFKDMDLSTTIYLNEGLEEIGAYAFSDVIVDKVTIPSTVTTIGEGSFSCTRLKSVTIPSNVSFVGESAFPTGLLSVTLNANPNNMTSFSLPATVNTIINKTSEIFTKTDAEAWINGTMLDYFDFREEDTINFKKTLYVSGKSGYSKPIVNDIPMDMYYVNYNGNNYLVDLYTNYAGFIHEITIPEGITHIIKGYCVIDMFQTYSHESSPYITFNMPDSLQVLNSGYISTSSVYKQITMNISESTDATGLSGHSSNKDGYNLNIREDKLKHVKLDYLEIWEGLKAENNYTYIKDGVKFEFSSNSGIGEIVESEAYSHTCVHADFDDLEIVISFVDENDVRVANTITLCAKDNYAIGSSHMDFNGYYYDKTQEMYIHLDPDNQDRTFNQTDPEDSSYDLTEGQLQWKLTFETAENNGLHVEYLELVFDYELPQYNGDLTIKTNA